MANVPESEGRGAAPEDGGAQEGPSNFALVAGRHLRDGFDAVINVRSVAKQHSSARNQLRQLQSQIEADGKELERREQIDRDFESISSTQDAAIAQSQKSLLEAQERSKALEQEQVALEERLEALKAEHEEKLRPYRELMESTRGRSDDAARSLADLRRAIRNADQQVTDAAKRREQRIAAANKAADNAQDRLRKVQAELTNLQQSPTSSASAISKMQSELVAEQAHLDAAREEVRRATSESQQLVDNAQTHLWTQKQSLETVERQADDAKREATARREEYEGLYNAAMDEEKALSDGISQRESGIASAQKEQQAAQKLIDEAQAILDEAISIHETPELSEALRVAIVQNQQELSRQQAEVEELAQDEQALRDKTRRQRYLFLAVMGVLAVAVLVAIILFALPH